MTPEQRRAWRRTVMTRWAKLVQAKGGEVVAAFDRVSLRLGERLVLAPQSWAVRRGQRLGVLGESGCGKSMQLRLLAGEASPSEGAVVRGPAVRVALVDQDAPSRLRACRLLVSAFAREQLAGSSGEEGGGGGGGGGGGAIRCEG